MGAGARSASDFQSPGGPNGSGSRETPSGQDGRPLLFQLRSSNRITVIGILLLSVFYGLSMLAWTVDIPGSSSVALIPGLILTMVIPGYLLVRLTGMRFSRLSESIVFVIGAAIFFLFTAGLTVNTLLPLIGIEEPLAPLPLVLSVLALNCFLLYLAKRRKVDLAFDIEVPSVSPLATVLFTIPLLLVAGSVMGATNLNNGGSNTLAMVVLACIGLLSLAVLFLSNRLPASLFPYTLYFITLAILLGISLRGWLISGHDILYEYSVFQLTKDHAHWSIDYYRDAYNSCLSITILPTMLSALLPKIPDQLIFRVLFQILFALVPVALFLFLRKYLSKGYAFLAVLFFISQPPLLQDFAFMTRQELALFFNILILLVFATGSFSRRQRYMAATAFGISMIWSHYSTTYIAIMTFLLILIARNGRFKSLFGSLNRILVLPVKHILSRISFGRLKTLDLTAVGDKKAESETKEGGSSWLPGWRYVLALLFLTLFWNVVVTGTQNNFTTFVSSMYQNMSGQKGFDEYRAGLTDQFKIFSRVDKKSELVESYVSSHTGGDNTTLSARYAPDTWQSYDPHIDTKVSLDEDSGDPVRVFYFSGEMYKKVAKAFIIVGLIWLLFSRMVPLIIDGDFKSLMTANIFILMLALVLPLFSADYSLMRAYQQLLLVLCLPAVVGSYITLRIFIKRYTFYLSAIFFVLYFLLLSSFLPQKFGSGYPQTHLKNPRLNYDINNSHQS